MSKPYEVTVHEASLLFNQIVCESLVSPSAAMVHFARTLNRTQLAYLELGYAQGAAGEPLRRPTAQEFIRKAEDIKLEA